MNNIILEKSMVSYISQAKYYVLRDAKTGKALNVSYTEDGLKYTQDLNRKFIYFVNARLERVYDNDLNVKKIYFSGNLKMSNKVYVEKFEPRIVGIEHIDKAELTFTSKAYRLRYNTTSEL